MGDVLSNDLVLQLKNARQQAEVEMLNLTQRISELYATISALHEQSSYLDELVKDLDSKIARFGSGQAYLGGLTPLSDISRYYAEALISSPENKRVDVSKQDLTVKDMVLDVLKGIPGGLNVNTLTGYITSVFGVNVPRSTLSPTLSRMKQENLVMLHGDRWHFYESESSISNVGISIQLE